VGLDVDAAILAEEKRQAKRLEEARRARYRARRTQA